MTAEERATRRERRNLLGSLVAAVGFVLLGVGMTLGISGLLNEVSIQSFVGFVVILVGQVVTHVGFNIRGPRY